MEKNSPLDAEAKNRLTGNLFRISGEVV